MDDLKAGDVFLYTYMTGQSELLVVRSLKNYDAEYGYYMVGLAFIDMDTKTIAFSLRKIEMINNIRFKKLTQEEANLAKVLYG